MVMPGRRWIDYFRFLTLRIFILLTALLAGCVQKTPVPYLARAGDTIVLGLGGIQRNAAGNQHLLASDLQATITPVAGGTPIALSIGQPFKSFPDYGSLLNADVINGAFPFSFFDGGWFMVVTLPNDGSLQPGNYYISVTSANGKIINTKFASNSFLREGDLTQLPLEIVAGSGGTDSSYIQQFFSYASTYSLDISPSSTTGVSAVSGLQLYITYPKGTYLDPNHLPIAVPYNHNPFIQIAQNTVDNGTTQTLIVMLSTQQAFVPVGQQTALTPTLNDLSIHLLYFFASNSTASPTQLTSDFQIDLSRSHYYDTNGAVIPSMQPVLSYQRY